MKGIRLLACLALLPFSACGDVSSGQADAAPDQPDAEPGAPDAPPGTPDAAPGQPDGSAGCTVVPGTPPLGVEEVATGFDMPLLVTSPPGDPRLFVLEKTGGIWIIDAGTILPNPFLTIDVADVVSLSDERGLLGLAFHPDYATNGRFYTFYMDNGSDHVVSEWTVSSDANVADPGSETQVFFLNDFAGNHNGGMLAFGPNDGYLYIGIGDGGGAGDAANNGQDLNEYFGKLLRVDVTTLPYVIPSSNPFAGATAGLDEIWAYGLRNPWRWTFDRETGDLYIGDVGQGSWEEIDVQPAASAGGENYGWRQMEGTHCFNPSTGCNMTGKVMPVYEYDHGDGCTVIGGYVYRGCRMPGYHGTYFAADYCSSWVRSMTWDGAGGVTNVQDQAALAGGDIASFGEDADGELYIVRHNTGQIMRIIPQ